MTNRQHLFSALIIAAIVVLPHLYILPSFTYSIPLLILAWFGLKSTNETFADTGFRFNRFTFKALGIGILCAILILSFMQLVFFPVLELMVELDDTQVDLYDFIRASPWQFALTVVLGWLIGGLYEELVFHGFIFTRLEKMLPGKYGTQLSFLITALLFGGYHVQLGAAGLINALVVGAVYLALFLRFKRNLWYAIICHGTYNTIVITLIYMDYL